MITLLESLVEASEKVTGDGKVASYIPELKKADPKERGICVTDLQGVSHGAGDYLAHFTLQSITKVIALLLVLEDRGAEETFRHVHMEPTGDAFNSIVSLETKHIRKPFNPMINAGAITVASLVLGVTKEEKIERMLRFTRKLAANPYITYSRAVFESERETGDRNRSLAYFMKSTGILEGSVEDILDVYFTQCAMLGTCRDISVIGSVLAADGVSPVTGERLFSKENGRIVKTIMTTCGMYDASGEFAVDVGVPGKSGVGGGILCAVPGRMGIGTYGPSLDEKGNSVAGLAMLRELSRKLDLTIF